MGVEDELRARIAASDEKERLARRQAEATADQYHGYRERAMAEVLAVTREANRMLVEAGIKPAKLVSSRPVSLWFPSISRMMGDFDHGRGWAVVDNVVVDTDGHLWRTAYRYESSASRLRGRKEIRVEKAGGPGYGPAHQQCDAKGFYSTETDFDGNNPYRVDFLDQLKDGYAELLRHHRR